MDTHVTLKPGKERPLLARHHWIFSGAIAEMPEVSPGEILPVQSHDGQQLGYAYFQPSGSIWGRMLSFGNNEPLQTVRDNIKRAAAIRSALFDEQTTGYRLINSEGDLLPGLVVDRYADTLVVQITTAGMDKLSDLIVEELKAISGVKVIYEKSTGDSRQYEDLDSQEAEMYGELSEEPIEILEDGLRFLVDVKHGQKTGFYLDQRENRAVVRQIASDRNVLNCFSYSGGFSVHAAVGGAAAVTSVDMSEDALDLARKNFELNDIAVADHDFVAADVLKYLREVDLFSYDLVILDPPAFAKSRRQERDAYRGYKDINYQVMSKAKAGTRLHTYSCSYHFSKELFRKMLFAAARDAGRDVRIIGEHRQAPDHPANIYHPGTEYLKGFELMIY